MNRFSYAFCALIACVEIAAFGVSFLNDMQNNPAATVPLGVMWLMFRYFTIWTNTLIGVVFCFMALRRRMLSPAWLGALVLWILIVGLVYHLLLATGAPLHGLDWWSNTLYHSVAPVLVPIWWLFCAPKRGLRMRHAALWLIWPALYLVYALILGIETSFYPYFFLNTEKLGWGGVALWCVKFLIAFWLGGAAIVWIGRVLGWLRLSR